MRFAVVVSIALGAALGANVRDEQDCEMCGLLVWRLETMRAAKLEETQSLKERLQAAAKKRGVLGRTLRSEYPAELIDNMETYLESACKKDTILTSTACRGHNGNDASQLRNPGGGVYLREACKHLVEERCQYMIDEHAEELIEAAMFDLTANQCPDILTAGCSASRATALLGPLYGTGSGRAGHHVFLTAGVKDVWEKMPGLEPYYHNAARHISQYEPPPGWDPKGPSRQTLAAYEAPAKEEL